MAEVMPILFDKSMEMSIAGTSLTGNKMDASNLATLFAPNLLHNFADETPSVSSGISFSSSK